MNSGIAAVNHNRKPDKLRDLEVDPLLIHSRMQQYRYLAWLVVITLLAMLPFPWMFRSSYTSSADLHGGIELGAALIAMAAGLAFMARFYALTNHFYLFTGLALLINGAGDFAHGFAEFASLHHWIGVPHSSIAQFIPCTYVTGRILMAALLIVAACTGARVSRSRKPKWETIFASLGVFLVGVVLTIIAFQIPLPMFIYYERVISRPVDLGSGVLFWVALVFLLNRYMRTRHALVWWICLSAAVSLVGQIYMSFSRHMYDPLFDVAHLFKIVGYLVPLFGFSLCQIGVIRDGTLAREALSAQKEHLAVTLRSIGDAVIATDTESKVVEMNHVAETMTGCTRDMALGKPLSDVFHIVNEQTGLRCEDPVGKVLKSGIVIGLANHTALISRDGTRRSIADSGAPIRDESANIIGVVLVFRDVTEQRSAEAELALHRLHLERMVEQRTAELRTTNEQLRTEATERELADKARQRTEEALRESEELLRLAQQAARIGSFEWNIQTGSNVWTPELEAMYGLACGEFGKTETAWEQLVHPADREAAVGRVNLALETFEPVEGEWRVIWRDGSVHWIVGRFQAFKDTTGRLLRLAGANIDITERKKAEQDLKTYSEKLEEMVEMRTRELREAQEQMVRKEKLAILGQLAGGVGHELRNPLGAIKNATCFLNMAIDNPEPDVKETIHIIDEEVAACERIISSLLDFARPRSAARRKLDIESVVKHALSHVPIPADVQVINQLDGKVPAALGDPDQLGQVFGNIIVNAVQAMPNGGQLTITAEVIDNNWVAVSVSDTGVGIPKENLPKVFEPLFTTKAKGIGLGLAVTKTLVESDGGTIAVQSEAGKGTTFTVKVPLCKVGENHDGTGENQHPHSG